VLDIAPTRRRLTAVLFAGVALANTGYIAAITVSTLAARSMTGSSRLAGVPAAVAVMGTASGASLLAADIARAGRRRGLILGYVLAALGGTLAASAVVTSVYPLLLLGMFGLGFGQAASQLSRYAAADIAVPERRGSAVSMIVWAGTIGAVVGPSLLGFAGDLAISWGRAQYMGGFMVAAVFMTLASTAYAIALRPDPYSLAEPLPERVGDDTAATTSTWSNPVVQVAVVSMAFGQVVMVLMMTGTPIHIEDTGRGLDVVGLVISAHTVGMFAFSPLTGRLVDVFGTMKVMLGAVGILAASAIIASMAPDDSTPVLAFALFLLGVGWNAGFVASSALLSRHAGSRAQGSVDAMVWASSAMASLSSGIILDVVGYRALSLLSIGMLAIPLVLLMGRRKLITV
jgi:MFS family permease